MNENELKTLVGFFYEAGTLRQIPRSHRQTLLTNSEADNIASHSYRTALIGLFLAKEEDADPAKVVLMCLLHDLPETRTGDANWVHKSYVKTDEDRIIQAQLGTLPAGDELVQIAREYEQRESHESQVAKDADSLDQALILREYSWAGNKEADRWLRGKKEGKRLHTETAKRLMIEICEQRPSTWWDNLWTDKSKK